MSRNIVHCRECGEEYNIKRAKLGYAVCLECGDKYAHKIANFRARCSAPSYNKGAYQPVMTLKDARWVGRS